MQINWENRQKKGVKIITHQICKIGATLSTQNEDYCTDKHNPDLKLLQNISFLYMKGLTVVVKESDSNFQFLATTTFLGSRSLIATL